MAFRIVWSVRTKLLALVAAALVGGQLPFAGFAAWQEAQRYAALKQAALSSTAQIMAAAVARAAAEDAQGARDALRAIAHIDDVQYVAVVTPQGRLLADLGASEVLESDIRLKPGDPAPDPLALLGAHAIAYAAPIVLEGRTVGSLELIGELRDFSARIGAALKQTGVAGAVALALALLISGSLQRAITGPLRALVAAMARVRDAHDYRAALPPAGRDEIGALVSGFNAMIGEIGVRDRKLAAYAEGLERQVAERTDDFRRARDSAEEANRAKSDFLATMSHEIRTPMNGVLVMAELLAASDLAPRAKRQADIIARSGQSLLAIIDDILDFSKIEAGKLEVERLRVDPVVAVETALSLFHERARAKNLDLAAVFAPGLRAPVVGDPVRLGQVIGNLINNALKFTETGAVRVRVGPDPADPQRVRFSVIDTGIGIAPEKLDAVFGAFEQADRSTTRKYGGTGLGLAISKKLVAAMDGDLRVDSAAGAGADFHFSLKLAEGARDIAFPRQPAARRAVLCVGAAATAEALAFALARSGFAVETCSDAALPVLAAGDLLVIEAKAIRAAQRRLARGPLVALAELGDGGGESVLAAGWADCVLERPVALDDLAMICATLRDGAPLAERRHAARVEAAFAHYPGRTVLVADDNAVNREVASAALQRFGVEIDLVEDGAQAVAAIGRRRYDLVLMDGSMPVLDGFEATRLARAAEMQTGAPRLPIVALTAHVVGAGAQAWREAGMDGVLHKPFTLQALADVLGTWLGRAAAPPLAAPVAQDGGGAGAAEVLDPAVIDQLRQLAAAGKPEFLQRVCGLYRQHAPDTVRQIAAAFAAGDAEAVGRLAHGLKSMSFNMGAMRVAAAALELERGVREDKRALDAREIEALEAALAEALAALEQVSPLEAAA